MTPLIEVERGEFQARFVRSLSCVYAIPSCNHEIAWRCKGEFA